MNYDNYYDFYNNFVYDDDVQGRKIPLIKTLRAKSQELYGVTPRLGVCKQAIEEACTGGGGRIRYSRLLANIVKLQREWERSEAEQHRTQTEMLQTVKTINTEIVESTFKLYDTGNISATEALEILRRNL